MSVNVTNTSDTGTIIVTLVVCGLNLYLVIDIASLLSTTTHKNVICLVRPASASVIRKRFPQLTILVGDVSLPNLGLSSSDVAMLRQQVSHVFHCAGSTNQSLPYADLQSHVIGTAEVLLLASTLPQLQRCVLLSSTDVLPDNVPEIFPLQLTENRMSAYAKMKLHQEQVASDALTAGLSCIIVFRLGLLCGNGDDLVARLVKGCYRIGAVPALMPGLCTPAILPASIAANWIVNIACVPVDATHSISHVYHLNSETPLRYSDIFRTLKLTALPYAEWIQLAMQDSELKALLQYNNLFNTSERNINCDRTKSVLRLLKAKKPPTSENVLHSIVKNVEFNNKA